MALSGADGEKLFKAGQRVLVRIEQANRRYHSVRWRWLTATSDAEYRRLIAESDQARDERIALEVRMERISRKLDRIGWQEEADALRCGWDRIDFQHLFGRMITCNETLTSTN